MVRIKHRYLLCHILYPSQRPLNSVAAQKASNSSSAEQLIDLYAPTTPSLTPQLLIRAIRADIIALFGDYGAGLVGSQINLKYLSPATSTFILRVPRAHYRIVWATLTFMTALPASTGEPRKKCVIRVIRVSGTIRKAREEAVRRAKDLIRRIADEGRLGDLGLDGLNVESEEGNSDEDAEDESGEDSELGSEDEDEDMGVPIK